MNILKRIIWGGKRLLLDFRDNRIYQADKTAQRFNKTHGCPELTDEEKKEIDNYWSTYVLFRFLLLSVSFIDITISKILFQPTRTRTCFNFSCRA